MDTPIFTIEALGKHFAGQYALQDIKFQLMPGERLAVIGPAAAGKSVLLKCLMGLYACDAGSIMYCGAPLAVGQAAAHNEALPRRGMLFQHNALFDGLPVWENVAFERLQGGENRASARAHAQALLTQVGLGAEHTDYFPNMLSGGMQKRVGFARAIANGAKVLLLDNPTAGLDPILTRRIENMILEHSHTHNTTVVAVTADMSRICDTYDTIMVLYDGRIGWYGTTAQARKSKDAWIRQLLDGKRDGPMKVQLQ